MTLVELSGESGGAEEESGQRELLEAHFGIFGGCVFRQRMFTVLKLVRILMGLQRHRAWFAGSGNERLDSIAKVRACLRRKGWEQTRCFE
jgi:hypothetical protein